MSLNNSGTLIDIFVKLATNIKKNQRIADIMNHNSTYIFVEPAYGKERHIYYIF